MYEYPTGPRGLWGEEGRGREVSQKITCAVPERTHTVFLIFHKVPNCSENDLGALKAMSGIWDIS